MRGLPGPSLASSSRSIFFMNSFSLIHTGMADRKLRSPLGAKP
jgi:hypothetical protein